MQIYHNVFVLPSVDRHLYISKSDNGIHSAILNILVEISWDTYECIFDVHLALQEFIIYSGYEALLIINGMYYIWCKYLLPSLSS